MFKFLVCVTIVATAGGKKKFLKSMLLFFLDLNKSLHWKRMKLIKITELYRIIVNLPREPGKESAKTTVSIVTILELTKYLRSRKILAINSF